MNGTFNRKIEIRINDNYFHTGKYGVAIVETEGGVMKSLAKPLVMQDMKPGQMINPTLELQPEHMQGLFNAMWQMGFRPKDGTGNSGHLAALQYHLEDMRELVFKRRGK